MEANPLRHPILFGEYELSIDEKNRLPVPSAVRKMISPETDGEAFFLVVGMNRRPWLYPRAYYEQLATRTPSEMTPGEDRLAFDQMHFAMANLLEWDKQGRILIPEKLLKRTNLGRQVTLIGARDHLEMWNTEEWEIRREELLSRSSEIASKARQSGQ